MAIINDRTSYYMAGSIAESTAKSYDRAFKFWSDYASANGLPLLPVNPIDLGNCLSTMADYWFFLIYIYLSGIYCSLSLGSLFALPY